MLSGRKDIKILTIFHSIAFFNLFGVEANCRVLMKISQDADTFSLKIFCIADNLVTIIM